MTRRTGAAHEHATTVIRLFPGWADSVVWFSEPVAYAATHLSAALVEDLRDWDASCYAGLTPELEWRAPELAAAFLAQGARLARRLADEVGDAFLVEHDLGATHRRVRAAGPARNTEAAAAFRAMAAAARARWHHLDAVVERVAREGHTLEWRADPP